MYLLRVSSEGTRLALPARCPTRSLRHEFPGQTPGRWAGAGLDLHGIHVIGEHQSGPMAAFVHFLDELGFPERHFVLVDGDGLDPRPRRWFGLLNQQTLSQVDTLLVFRAPRDRPAPEPGDHGADGDLPQWVLAEG